jgi:hypothetical protein
MPAKEREADEQIKGAPKEVHEWRGIAHASRLGEGGGKWRALESAKEVRETIAKKGAGKERGNVAHGRIKRLVKGQGSILPQFFLFLLEEDRFVVEHELAQGK